METKGARPTPQSQGKGGTRPDPRGPGVLILLWVFKITFGCLFKGNLSLCWSQKVSDFGENWDKLRTTVKDFAFD